MGRIQSEHIGYRFGLLEPRNPEYIFLMFSANAHIVSSVWTATMLYISVIAINRLQEAKEYAKRWKCNSKAYKNTPDYVLFAEKTSKNISKTRR